MRNLYTVSLLGAFFLAACQPTPNSTSATVANTVLPAGVSAVGNNLTTSAELSIPYQKYQLDNGLTVVLHQDTSDPLVHIDVTYHVGSAREEYGKSGFAHFFEHMMFQGSENIGDDQHFQIITDIGGTMNGSTNSDRTNYYQTVPANQLEKVLWMEADRMGFLLDAVTQEKFEIQRATVKNERGQRYDNQPYGLRHERTIEALYPKGHPYSWSTIGYVEDLNRVDVNDLKAFFQRWYGPNNAVLTIGGDIDIANTLAWVVKYFGSIPRGPEVTPAPKSPAVLAHDKYLTLEDQVHLPLLQVTYPTVYVRHEDEAPLDVLADVLGNGKTSLFYKNLVKQGLAVQALVSHPCRELACEFQLIALANPQNTPDLAKMQAVFQQTLNEFEQRGVSEDDLNRTKASIESSTVFGLQSVAGKVSSLAADQIFSGEPDKVQYDLDRYRNVTRADVMRVYNKYIKGKAKVVLSVVPQGKPELAAAKANFVLPARDIPTSTGKAPDVKAATINDSFDRSQLPPAGNAVVVKTPSFVRQDWDNGVVFVAHQSTETPTVTLTFSMEGGPLLDPANKAGLASMTAAMMNESTQTSTNEELANQLALLGSRIDFNASGRYTQVQVSSLVKNLPQTLAILKEKLFSPAFRQSDFNRLMQRTLQGKQQSMKRPGVLASMAVDKVLYGDNNRISLPDTGTLQSLQNISLQDVQDFYQRYYSPRHANLILVGDIRPADAQKQLAFLADWQGKDYQVPAFNDFPALQGDKIYLVDQPGAAQSVLRMVKRDLPYDATGEHFRRSLANFALGGMFNSRINMNLREDKGYTYGARSAFIGGKQLGRFQIGSDVKQANTGDAIQEVLDELALYQQKGMTEAELATMRNAYTLSDALNYETPGDKAGFLRQLLSYDLPADYTSVQNRLIEQITLAELNQLAADNFKAEDLQIIVVGDASKITPQLESLGREVVPLVVN